MTEPENKWAKRRRELEEKRARERGETVTDDPAIPEEDIPDFGEREKDELDRILDKVDILEAYRLWCNKMVPKIAPGQTESIMISCPWHPDEDPSAWINTKNQTYNCGSTRCGISGSKFTIAAKYFNMEPKPTGADFRKLRELMAESLGWHPQKGISGTTWYQEEDEAPPVSKSDKPAKTRKSPAKKKRGKSDGLEESTSKKTDSNIHLLQPAATDEATHDIYYPDVPWRDIVPEDTFLREYLETTCNDDSPEAYHFWHGLIALGHAAGRNVVLDDDHPVHANLFLCLMGRTGIGKSRSKRWLDEVIDEIMPFKDNGMEAVGVKLIPQPGSGEYLIKCFQFEGRDPSDPKVSLGLKSVNGIVDFDEFASLIARIAVPKSTLKPTLQQFADCLKDVKYGSMTQGEMTAYEPFCTIISSTQPTSIRELLNRYDAGSGFLNRWIFAGGVPKKRQVVGGARNKMGIDLTIAKEELQKVYTWCGKPRRLYYTDEGNTEIEKFWETLVEPTRAKDTTDLLQRLDLLFKKLILLFCINEKKKEADADVINRVSKMFKYVTECFNILDANIGITLSGEIEKEIERTIARHFASKKKGCTVRDINMYLKTKNYPPELLVRVIKNMVELGSIVLEPRPPGPGRKTDRYRLAANE